MRYFGSKYYTLPKLTELITARISEGSFCDAFGGIGTVGAHFKSKGYEVWTGDVLLFAHYFQLAKIQRERMPAFNKLRKALNLASNEDLFNVLVKRRRKDGWLVKNYAIDRHFFTLENARAIESVWKNIIGWNEAGYLNLDERALLFASLINAMDKVANTAGTYYAYLKSWTRKAEKPFLMELLRPTAGLNRATCFFGTANELVKKQKFDVLYLDPPYNDRSYSHYYHLPETIANGITPKVHGRSGISNERLKRSVFNDAATATSSLKALLELAQFRLLAFHYADDGIISRSQVQKILSTYGNVQEFLVETRGYTTKQVTRRVNHRLYLVQRD